MFFVVLQIQVLRETNLARPIESLRLGQKPLPQRTPKVEVPRRKYSSPIEMERPQGAISFDRESSVE